MIITHSKYQSANLKTLMTLEMFGKHGRLQLFRRGGSLRHPVPLSLTQLDSLPSRVKWISQDVAPGFKHQKEISSITCPTMTLCNIHYHILSLSCSSPLYIFLLLAFHFSFTVQHHITLVRFIEKLSQSNIHLSISTTVHWLTQLLNVIQKNSPITLVVQELTASPALLMALHIYTPESSSTHFRMSSVTYPKSWLVVNLEPGAQIVRLCEVTFGRAYHNI